MSQYWSLPESLGETHGEFISSAPRQHDRPIVFLVDALTRSAFPFSDLMHQEERNLSDIGGLRVGFDGREVAQLHTHSSDSSGSLMGSSATHIDSAAV